MNLLEISPTWVMSHHNFGPRSNLFLCTERHKAHTLGAAVRVLQQLQPLHIARLLEEGTDVVFVCIASVCEAGFFRTENRHMAMTKCSKTPWSQSSNECNVVKKPVSMVMFQYTW